MAHAQSPIRPRGRLPIREKLGWVLQIKFHANSLSLSLSLLSLFSLSLSLYTTPKFTHTPKLKGDNYTIAEGLLSPHHLKQGQRGAKSRSPRARTGSPPPRALPSSPACQTARKRQQQCCSRSLKLHEARGLCSPCTHWAHRGTRCNSALVVDNTAAGRWRRISVRGSESDCARSKPLLSTTESTAIFSSGMLAQAAGASSSAPARSCRCVQQM